MSLTEIDTLRTIIGVFLWIAAISTTSFPVLYSFSGWKKTYLGRILMMQAIAFAFAVNLTLLTHYWTPFNLQVRLWFFIFAFGFIAVSTACLTYLLWRANFKNIITEEGVLNERLDRR